MNDMYTTPEGFELARPLLLPDARKFSDVLTFVRFWDYETMNHRNGVIPRPELVPEPRLSRGSEIEIGPFCHVQAYDRRVPMAVTATDATLDALADQVLFDDRISFEVIHHVQNDRALVLAQGNIGRRYLAYIDPASIPMPEVES